VGNDHGIKKETYVDADEKTKSALTFDMLDNISSSIDTLNSKFEAQVCACTEKINSIDKKVDKRRLTDKGFAGMTGVIGGYLSGLFK
jgi:hypothetical protein